MIEPPRQKKGKINVEHIIWFAFVYLRVVIQPHQKVWLDHIINGGLRVLLLAPRGHGKTTTVIVVYLTYMICYYPHVKILLAAHKEALARSKARMIQINLSRKMIQKDFEIAKGAPWRRDEFYLKHKGEEMPEPVVFCVAGQAGMTGYRFDMIIFDDLLVKDNQRTEQARDKLLEWIEEEVLKARDPSDLEKVVVVGTRKHHKDWYSQLIASPFYDSRIDKAILDDESVLWPHMLDIEGNEVRPMYTKEKLMERKITEGARSFAQEYQNDPSPPEGMALKREWLKFYDGTVPDGCSRYMGIDPSMGSTDERASGIAIVVVDIDERPDHEHIYTREIFKDKMPRGKQIEKIVAMIDKWNPISVHIEGVFGDKYLAQHVVDMFPRDYVQLVDYVHSPLKGISDKSKEERIKNYIGMYFEEGYVSVLDPRYDHATREFIEEEYVEFPTKSAPKDVLDAYNMAVDLAQFGGYGEGLPIHLF